MTKTQINESGIQSCPDCGHVLDDGENDDTLYCTCCDELVPLKMAKVIPRE